MEITKLHLDENSLSNGGELLAVDIRTVKHYEGGQATDRSDYKVSVVAVKNGYNRFDITISEKPLFDIQEGNPVPVTFEGLSVKTYRKFDGNTGYGLSCKAKSVSLVKKM